MISLSHLIGSLLGAFIGAVLGAEFIRWRNRRERLRLAMDFGMRQLVLSPPMEERPDRVQIPWPSESPSERPDQTTKPKA